MMLFFSFFRSLDLRVSGGLPLWHCLGYRHHWCACSNPRRDCVSRFLHGSYDKMETLKADDNIDRGCFRIFVCSNTQPYGSNYNSCLLELRNNFVPPLDSAARI